MSKVDYPLTLPIRTWTAERLQIFYGVVPAERKRNDVVFDYSFSSATAQAAPTKEFQQRDPLPLLMPRIMCDAMRHEW